MTFAPIVIYYICHCTKETACTANWLDKTFLPFDRKIFSWMHALAGKAGGFMNGFAEFVSFFGEGGWLFIALAIVFLLFKRMRREGLGMAFALAIGALVTNILLKNIVDRARPFTREGTPFGEWWIYAGKSFEDSASFPSGHTTAAFAAAVSFFILGNKRYSWTGLVFAFLMGLSRIYLIVHYPTDVIAGFVIGSMAGVGGAFLSKLVYRKARGKFGAALNEWSIVAQCKALARKGKTSETPAAPENEDSSEKNTQNDGQSPTNPSETEM